MILAAFACLVAYVNDGDTLRCQDGTRVRLAGIDSAELPGHCNPGRQCTRGNPYAAKRSLERLVAGRTLQCDKVGTSYRRVVAFCRVGGTDLSCAQLRAGQAVRRYENAEAVCRR